MRAQRQLRNDPTGPDQWILNQVAAHPGITRAELVWIPGHPWSRQYLGNRTGKLRQAGRLWTDSVRPPYRLFLVSARHIEEEPGRIPLCHVDVQILEALGAVGQPLHLGDLGGMLVSHRTRNYLWRRTNYLVTRKLIRRIGASPVFNRGRRRSVHFALTRLGKQVVDLCHPTPQTTPSHGPSVLSVIILGPSSSPRGAVVRIGTSSSGANILRTPT